MILLWQIDTQVDPSWLSLMQTAADCALLTEGVKRECAVSVRLCDDEGNPIEGFDSGRLFGDSVDRPVDFAGDLNALSGKPVRMLIEMKDAELYAFKFSEDAPV